MKHICFLNSAFEREDALIVYRQGKSLVEAGYRVSYTVRDGKPNEVKEGIEIINLDTNPQSMVSRIISNTKIFKNFLISFNADVYQINEPELLHIGLWLKRKGKVVVFNLREWYPEYYKRKVSSPFLQRMIRACCEKYFSYISSKYDAVFNCMPEMHDYIEKVMPCKYFYDTPNFPVINREFNLTYEEFAKRDQVISYFGSIYNISCQEEFLEALACFPEARYTLAGVFYDETYRAKAEAMPGWSQTTFINGFTRDQLPAIINSSIIGHVVKDFDQTETPQGSYSIIKIFETMEAAVPVILAKVPLYERMVDKYNCGICVRPHSVEDWKNALSYLLAHRKEAYEMGQNGRRAVIEEFSWDSYAPGYVEIFNKLVQ